MELCAFDTSKPPYALKVACRVDPAAVTSISQQILESVSKLGECFFANLVGSIRRS